MADPIAGYFRFDRLGTTYRREIVAGLTTFVTMAYIIIVNPKILEAAGIPFGPSMVATILTGFFGTMAMALYARRPFAIAPYMCENAFIAYTVVQVLGYTWQAALGAIFVAGVLFVAVSLLGIRSWLSKAISPSLKIAFAVGIGLFMTFIGLNEIGVVTLGTVGAPVHVGNLTNPAVILGVVCFLLIGLLAIRRIYGALLLGILIVTFLSFLFGVVEVPKQWLSLPPSLAPVFLQLDIRGALTWGFFPVVLTVFVMSFVDTTGTLLGLALKSGFLDDKGELPEIEKPMLCDAVSTVFAPLVGTTTSGAFIESAAGIEAGGRSGFASVITAFLFLLTLFFAPFLTVVPPAAYGAALVFVGLLMMAPIVKLDFNDLTESIPAFVVIILMSFTYNLGIGITGGFAVYPLMKLFAGRWREVSAGMWVLAALSALFFIFYPY
jgi:AGZA family xanthine/uracil permease-like MFS transporter